MLARQTEIIDGLVDLLIILVHKVDATAERKVGGELLDDLRRVWGKEGILFAVAEAALDHPDDNVRAALYPVVSEATLKDLVAEARANDTVFRQRGRTVLRSSYSAHYRRMLPKLLAALDFRSNNTAYRPVMDALDLLRRYAERPSRERFYAEADTVPLDGVVPREWRDAVLDEAGRIERIPYELCVLRSLREAIRCPEVYVAGANRWRNPEDDLPPDFEANRDMHYAAIRQPLAPPAFVDDLRSRMRDALTSLDEGIAAGTTGGVRITTRRGEPWISVPTRRKLPEPANLVALKGEVQRRWGVLDLLDVLKEADFDAGFTEEFTSVASREITNRALLRRRLLLVLFALGTNVGIRHVVGGETEAMLRRVRRLFVNQDNLRRGITRLVNATFAVPRPLWGRRGHDPLARGAQVGVHLLPAQELLGFGGGGHAGGAARHFTSAEVDTNYVDTHGASVVGFALCHLLGFKLMPRLKNIDSARLSGPGGADDKAWDRIVSVISGRPIDWDPTTPPPGSGAPASSHPRPVRRAACGPRSARSAGHG